MCEKCNCKTTEENYQVEEGTCGVSQSNKKDIIENSLNFLFNSLDVLESLDERISNIQIEESGSIRHNFAFESLEALLNNLPDELYKTSNRIYKVIDNINAKLF